jgi:hypothetical protein
MIRLSIDFSSETVNIIVKKLSFQQCAKAIVIGEMKVRNNQKSLVELEKPAKL